MCVLCKILMKYTVRCTCTLSCMINDVYIYQGVPCMMYLIMADYWTECWHPPGHPMSSVMLWDIIKGTSPYIQCMHVCVCVCMNMPRYICACASSRVSIFTDLSV